MRFIYLIFFWLFWTGLVLLVFPVPESFLGLVGYYVLPAVILGFSRK